ncbi:MAG: phosphatidylglycerol lysyltransferase domain-containing protein [Methanoregulaceae archaeon]|nr:phosphatidylglycerol lysyltransferase domain-containing protein [Methanoregulaceae archaeon]
MLTLKDFKPVTLADQAFFRDHYARYPQVHSDNTFTNMVCWNHYAHYEYAYSRGNILISSTIGDNTTFRPPIGPPDETLLRELIRLAVDFGDEVPLVLIDTEAREWILEVFPELELREDPDYAEYVYLSSMLADLPGKEYVTIRHQLNKFRRNCAPAVESINPGMLGEVREFLIEWCEWKECDGKEFLANEKDAILFAISHFDLLGLSGLAIRVQGKIGAISLYEPLNRDTVVIHFEKGLPDCEGIYKAINTETAQKLHRSFHYINRESDMGVPGLREAKIRYHPDHKVWVYSALKNGLVQYLR